MVLEDKEQLARESFLLVEDIIRYKFKRFIPWRGFDIMFSDGLLGLAIAINKYDREKEIKFKTYAQTWIIGKIIDGFRVDLGKNFHSPKRELFYRTISLEDLSDDNSSWEIISLDIDFLLDFKKHFPRALKQLTDTELEVYNLAEIWGYGPLEIARQRKCHQTNITHTIKRAKQKIGEYLIVHSFWEN